MKIGLCLSGGGARAAAHIGVIEALREIEVYPDVVSGASAGALVGALYCAGMNKEEMLAFSRKGSLIKAFKFGIPDRGLGSLNFLKILLEKHIDQRNFEDLDRKLFVTATNLLEGKAEVFSEGELINPLLASCAIPVAFSPIEFNSQVYIDGGTMDNFPIGPLLDCDYIIGVNLLPRVKVGAKSVSSFRGVLARTFDLSILGNAGNKLGQTNITISPIQLNKFGIFNFGRADELYEVGYQAALKVMDVISGNLESIKRQSESS